MADTTKECPNCHTQGMGSTYRNQAGQMSPKGIVFGPWSYRKENELCGPCQKHIQTMEVRIAELNAAQAGLTEYRLNERPVMDLTFSNDHERRDIAQQAICAVIQALTAGTRKDLRNDWRDGLEIVPKERSGGAFDDSRNRAQWSGRMTPEAAAAIQNLYECFIEFTENAYATGKKRGENILIALAENRIGLNEFEERISRTR